MTQSPQDPNWLAWTGAAVPMAVATWGFFKRFFATVTREELQTMLDRQEELRLELHKENTDNFRTLFDRMGKLEQSQARAEGMLSSRYPRLPS